MPMNPQRVTIIVDLTWSATEPRPTSPRPGTPQKFRVNLS